MSGDYTDSDYFDEMEEQSRLRGDRPIPPNPHPLGDDGVKMKELLLCPFCGFDPFRPILDEGTSRYLVMCDGCECEGPLVETEADAIAAWNRRAVPSPKSEGWALAIEAAAKVADGYAERTPDSSLRTGARWIAQDIRALPSPPVAEGE